MISLDLGTLTRYASLGPSMGFLAFCPTKGVGLSFSRTEVECSPEGPRRNFLNVHDACSCLPCIHHLARRKLLLEFCWAYLSIVYFPVICSWLSNLQTISCTTLCCLRPTSSMCQNRDLEPPQTDVDCPCSFCHLKTTGARGGQNM